MDSRGNNALHLAVKEGHLEVVRVLLTESEVDAEAVNNKGRNSLHVLANFGKDTSVPIFLLFMECMPAYPINRPDAEGNSGKFWTVGLSMPNQVSRMTENVCSF